MEPQSTFLFQAWDKIQSFPYNPLQCTLIVPSGRAGRELGQIIKAHQNKAFVYPEICTLSEWTQKHYPALIASPHILLLELYQCIPSELLPKPNMDFDSFRPLGKKMLADFNEIDHYLIDPQQIFSNLRNLKELEEWSFLDENISEIQINYENIYTRLYQYYELFQTHLDSLNLSYNGKKMRYLVKALANKLENKANQHWFIGFNAFTKAEESIIEQLIELDLAQVIWDADQFYLNDNKSAAGEFFMGQDHENYHFLSGGMCENEIQLNLISCSGALSQAWTCAHLLHDSQNKAERTAIIPADVQCFEPLIYQLDNLGLPYNTSLTKSLSQCTLFELLKKILQIQLNLRVSGHCPRSEVLSLISLIDYEEALRQQGLLKLQLYNTEGLHKVLDTFWHSIFKPASDNLINLADDLLAQSHSLNQKLPPNPLNRELSRFLPEIISNIKKLHERYPNSMSHDWFAELLIQGIGELELSYTSNPDESIQITGMLETRALDFDRVFILGGNEDVMPAKKQNNSFIPNDIRRYFGLPDPDKGEKIFAYYVYRLFHRAKEVNVLYNSVAADDHPELSRFFRQIQFLLPRKNPRVKINEKSTHWPSNSNSHSVEFKQSSASLTRVYELLQNGISPTHIALFYSCKASFYTRYILGIKEPNHEDTIIENSHLGSLVHACLDRMYSSHKGLLFGKMKLQNKSELKDLVFTEAKKLFGSEPESGAYRIMAELALIYIDKFRAMAKAENLLLDTELQLKSEITVTLSNGSSIPVLIKGVCDRVEQEDKVISIVDYKTNLKQNYSETISSWEEVHKSKNRYAAQLAIYGWMYVRQFGGMGSLNSSIYYANQDKSPLRIGDNKESRVVHFDQQDMLAIDKLIREFILELTDEDLVYKHNSENQYCSYCN